MHGSGLKIGVAPVLHEGEPQDRGHLVTLLERARDELRGNDYRRVEQVAAMRLPVHFAVGRVFPRVDNWVLTTELRGQTWSTAAPDPGPYAAEMTPTSLTRRCSKWPMASRWSTDPTWLC